ncbi:MAG: hypothetical protein A2X64_01010 [Ignavibacteria bacterium GWF2_33_9]|nr:MAG: hypothetical protein A2X64_01010 [Ignavibacteria bacterium GWF2_33_9]
MRITEIVRKVLGYLNLQHQIDDYDVIHNSITKDIEFKGTNLWILIFAIVIASVGLNMNSTAVIIGAMLISPLMGPINGMGYSIAIYDFSLLRKSLKHFTFAVVTSLFASTAYFYLTPIYTAHSELLARTSPTIYDVMIALFGGMAGIVAISSKQKGNVIPGVAIATALMPPLCTAGYGLATFQAQFFLGAIYLFTINTFFIGLSSVIISQILKFPLRSIIDDKQKGKTHKYILGISALILLPSIYLGYNLVQKERFSDNAKKYIENVGIFEGNYLLKSDINTNEMIITLVYGGERLDSVQQFRIKDKATNFDLNTENVKFMQGLDFDSFDRNKNEVDKLKSELNKLTLVLSQRNRLLDSLKSHPQIGKQILKEIRILYPQLVSCSYGTTLSFNDSLQQGAELPIVIFNKNDKLEKVDFDKIKNWLKNRLNSDSLFLFINSITTIKKS